jgi:hypothetical protein
MTNIAKNLTFDSNSPDGIRFRGQLIDKVQCMH